MHCGGFGAGPVSQNHKRKTQICNDAARGGLLSVPPMIPQAHLFSILLGVAAAGTDSRAAATSAAASGWTDWQAGPEIFPARWREAPFLAAAQPAPDAERARARRLVERAIAKYPPAMISNTLHRVYILGSLTFFGDHAYSGTASADDVYLVVGSEADGYSDRFVESRFHAEYSTLLLNRYLKHFNQAAWQRVNPRCFRYAGGNSWDRLSGKDGGNVAIDEGKTSLEPSMAAGDLKAGFLTEYSRSGIENDFNEYAAALFMNEPSFRSLARAYSGVAAKRRLAIRFYRAIDPALTERYFDSIRPPPAPGTEGEHRDASAERKEERP